LNLDREEKALPPTREIWTGLGGKGKNGQKRIDHMDAGLEGSLRRKFDETKLTEKDLTV